MRTLSVSVAIACFYFSGGLSSNCTKINIWYVVFYLENCLVIHCHKCIELYAARLSNLTGVGIVSAASHVAEKARLVGGNIIKELFRVIFESSKNFCYPRFDMRW